MTDALIVHQLFKQYGQLTAVDNISFSVKRGSCFGLLGPNGAGKTTTLEMIEGIVSPDSGDIDYPLLNKGQSLQQHIGIQFQETALQDHIKVKETLNLFANLYNDTSNISELISLCSLQDFLDQDTKKLSGGQRQRLLLALALLHNPELVFLDEPTTGLDPQSRRNFWTLVKRIKEQGKTLILTTHYMDEAQQLCDEIVVIDRGKIIEQGKPEDLLNQHFSGTIIRIKNHNGIKGLLPSNTTFLEDQGLLEFSTSAVEDDIKSIVNAGISLEGLSIHRPNLEDLFIKLTGHQLRS
ncbi:MAG: ABC transporter ATP-binding protein [Gammaproteobacteria bacterium]|nr:ABC transporter ATP-binding protein [Gammaproteobacteria bacterium]